MVENEDILFFQACINNDIYQVINFLDKDIYINIKNEDGFTGLSLACINGHFDIVKLIIDRGADIRIANKDGNTGFHLACEYGHIEIIKLLINQGMDINTTNNEEATGLHIACEFGFINIVKLFFDIGMKINITTRSDINNFQLVRNKELINYLTNKIDNESEDIIQINDDNDIYYCNICSIHTQNMYEFDIHCMSMEHKDYISKAASDEISNLPPFLMRRNFSCESCNYFTMHKSNLLLHYKSSSHKILPNIDITSQSSMLRCGLKCNYKTNDRLEYKRHIQSILHLSNVPLGHTIQKQRFIDSIDYYDFSIEKKKINPRDVNKDSIENEVGYNNDDYNYEGFNDNDNDIGDEVNEINIKNISSFSSSPSISPTSIFSSPTYSTQINSLDIACNGVYCNICELMVGGSLHNYDFHCMGKHHLEILKISSPEEVAKLAPFNMLKTFYCKACDYETINKTFYIQHMKKKNHIPKYNSKSINSNHLSMYRCRLFCNFHTKDIFDYQMHIESSKHLANIPNGTNIQRKIFKKENFNNTNKNASSIQLGSDHDNNHDDGHNTDGHNTDDTLEIIINHQSPNLNSKLCYKNESKKKQLKKQLVAEDSIIKTRSILHLDKEEEYDNNDEISTSFSSPSIRFKKEIINKNIIIEKNNQQFSCNICDFHGKTLSSFDNHCTTTGHKDSLSKATPEEIEALPPYLMHKMRYCNGCNLEYSTKFHVKYHINSVHHQEISGSNQVDMHQEGMYRCGLACNFTSIDRSEYERHVQSEIHLANIPEGKVLQKQRYLTRNNEASSASSLSSLFPSSSSSSELSPSLLLSSNVYQLASNGKAPSEQIEFVPPDMTLKMFYCEFCKYKTYCKASFKEHMNSIKHEESNQVDMNQEISGSNQVDMHQEGMYRCGLACNFTSIDRSEYERHVQSEIHLANIPEGKVLQKQRYFIDTDIISIEVDKKRSLSDIEEKSIIDLGKELDKDIDLDIDTDVAVESVEEGTNKNNISKWSSIFKKFKLNSFVPRFN